MYEGRDARADQTKSEIDWHHATRPEITRIPFITTGLGGARAQAADQSTGLWLECSGHLARQVDLTLDSSSAIGPQYTLGESIYPHWSKRGA